MTDSEWTPDQLTIPDEHTMAAFKHVLSLLTPRQVIPEALDLVINEPKRRKRDEEEAQRQRDRENDLARSYHEAVAGSVEKVLIDDVEYPVWAAPIGPFAAYPTGMTVAHKDAVWTVVSPAPTTTEPGTTDDWTNHEEEA